MKYLIAIASMLFVLGGTVYAEETTTESNPYEGRGCAGQDHTA